MTAVIERDAGPLRVLPLLLPGILYLFALLLIPVAPAGVTDGLYRIDTPEFSISHVDIDCVKDGTIATCTTPVGSAALTITLDTDRAASMNCTAKHGSRSVPCTRSFDYGPGSDRVDLPSLDVSPDEAAALRAAVPWWSTLIDTDWVLSALAMAVVLALAAAVAAWLWAARPRPALRRRWVATLVTAVVAWTFPAVSAQVLATWDDPALALFTLIVPHTVVGPTVAVAIWQWSVGGAVTGTTGQRARHTAGAAVVALVYAAAMMLWLSIAAGFPD